MTEGGGQFEQDNQRRDWQSVFCGRAGELKVLQDAWQAVSSGTPQPKLVVLVGESGLGKTRIVQEFYRWLVAQAELDGPSYWPSSLASQSDNLKLNPDVMECDPNAPMSLLWWGMRLADPESRNSIRGGLTADSDMLAAHLYPFAEEKLRRKLETEWAVDLTKDVALELTNALVFNLAGIASMVVKHTGKLKDLQERRTRSAHFDIKAAAGKITDDLVEKALQDFRLIFDRKRFGGVSLPVVLVIDDAQWLGQDPSTQKFVQKLSEEAIENGWPLLTIATHWEREWKESISSDSASFASMCRELPAWYWLSITLSKEGDLDGLILAALPSVPPPQRRIILDKADGNPRLLKEIIHFLHDTPRLFKDKNTSGALTKTGAREIDRLSLDVHRMVLNRLRRAPQVLRTVVGLASIQGIQFGTTVTVRAATGLGEANAAGGLSAASNPYSVIQFKSSSIGEFAQRVYREAAEEQLLGLYTLKEAREAVGRAIDALDVTPLFLLEDFPHHERLHCWAVGLDYFLGDKRSPYRVRRATRCLWGLIAGYAELGVFDEVSKLLDRLVELSGSTQVELNYLEFAELTILATLADMCGSDALSENISAAILRVAGVLDGVEAMYLRASSAKLQGGVSRGRGQLDDAKMQFEIAEDILLDIALSGSGRSDRWALMELAHVKLELSRVCFRQKNMAEASLRLMQVVDFLRPVGWSHQHGAMLPEALRSLAIVRREIDGTQAAAPILDEAIQLWQDAPDLQGWANYDRASLLYTRAEFAVQVGDLTLADEVLLQAVALAGIAAQDLPGQRTRDMLQSTLKASIPVARQLGNEARAVQLEADLDVLADT